MAIIQKFLGGLNLGDFSANVSKFLHSFSLSDPKLIFGGIVLAMILLWGISLGRTRALISLLCIYIAFVFDNTFIYLKQVDSLVTISPQLYITRIALFLIVYCAVFLIINRSILKPRLTISESSIMAVIFVTILQLGLLISIITNMLPGDTLSSLPEYITPYIATRTALFIWTLAPLLSLLSLKAQKKRSF